MTISPIPANIRKFLKVLGMKTSFISGVPKVPSYAEVRKTFRGHLLKEHPDKGGKNASFQELSEAARELVDYIKDNPDMVEEEDVSDTDTLEEKDNLEELLRLFTTSSDLKYNKECVVFNVEKEEVSEWMEKLQEYFGNKRDLKTKSKSLMFKNEAWVLQKKEGEEETGSVAVTFYPDLPNPKIMVQGTMHMAFVNRMLPTLAMSAKKKVPLAITDKTKDEIVKESSDKVKETAIKGGGNDGQNGTQNSKDITAKDVVSAEETPNDGEQAKNNNKVMEESMKESQAAAQSGNSKDDINNIEAFEKDPASIRETLERFQMAFIKKCGDIDDKLTISLEKQADMTKHIAALKEEVVILKEEVKVSKDEIKTEIKEAGNKGDAFKENMDKKINSVLDACKDLQKRIDSMKKSMASELAVPKVMADNPEVEAKDPTEGEVIEVEEDTKKKVIFFHSSVASDLDMKRFETATNSDMVMVKTSCLLSGGSTVKPSEFLAKTVTDNMKDDINLAIFAVGSNDVANIQEDETLGTSEKIAAVKEQSEHLVQVADNLVKENKNLEAFIVEQIPRHDNPEKTKLQKLANSYLDILIMESSSRLHLVSQSSLFRQPGEARDRTYRNGNHLTSNGLYHYNTNLISEIQDVFTDMKGLNIHPPKQVKKTEQVKPAGGVAWKQQQLPAKGSGQQRKGYQNSSPQQPLHSKPREQQHRQQQGLT